MLENFIKDHIAVSSLESPAHANRKDPKILSITWFIGKRCNYDCSYCAPWVHDNYSSHIKKDKIFYSIDQIQNFASFCNKQFKINITGGEPFVHPNFIEILKYIKLQNKLTQLSVVTNGSLPLHTYIESTKYLTNLTVSLHLEQSLSVIESTVQKILDLNRIKNIFLNVNLMMLPGKLNLVKDLIQTFDNNKVKFVLRKIDPPNINFKNNTIKKGDIKKINEENKNFIENKIQQKKENIENLDEKHLSYYSKQELKFLENYKNPLQWNNIKLHLKEKTVEVNTDEIKAKNLNSWKNWHCYVGIDSLYIQHTGEIFRGNCMEGKSIGKIGEKINWPTSPIICPVKYCTCNSDMVIRKVKNIEMKNYIDE